MTTAQRTANNAIKSALFTRNILSVYYSASPADIQGGSDWYARAQVIAKQFSATYGLSVEVCAGVISALSPRKEWSINVRIAESIIARYTATGLSALRHGGTLTAQLRQVDKVLSLNNPTANDVAESFGGPKTAAFARNIIGDLSGVCVDGHASNIAFHGMTRLGIPDATSPKGPLYGLIAAAYTNAAKQLGIAPATLQAVTWLSYKSLPIPRKASK